MSEPDTPPEDDALEAAEARLERACAGVAARLRDLSVRIDAAEAGVRAARESDADRARLAEALDEARAREQELGAAAADASEALEAAMADLRLILTSQEPGE